MRMVIRLAAAAVVFWRCHDGIGSAVRRSLSTKRLIREQPDSDPAAGCLLLFLSGWAGIGFLGRHKAGRRETAAA